LRNFDFVWRNENCLNELKNPQIQKIAFHIEKYKFQVIDLI